jgi:CDP-diacylglycerol---serine O-phosphatidyltransferase
MIKDFIGKLIGFIPNLFTLSNLVCGVLGIYFAFENQLMTAFYLMLVAALFDFLDGFLARLLKVSGELGKQLDSLADLITFGLLPGVMLFSVQRILFNVENGNFQQLTNLQWFMLISPVLIPVFSAYRLAKFNIDTRQSHSFIGLPTPANALFIASLTTNIVQQNNLLPAFIFHPVSLTCITLLFSGLLVSGLPLFALKFKSFGWKGNEIRYLFLILSLLIILAFQLPGIMYIILLYLLLSLVSSLKSANIK